MKLLKNILLILSLMFGSICFSQTELKNTTISVDELKQLREDSKLLAICDSLLSDYKVRVIRFKVDFKKKEQKIFYLETKNRGLTEKINIHNNKLKKSQEKFKIETN